MTSALAILRRQARQERKGRNVGNGNVSAHAVLPADVRQIVATWPEDLRVAWEERSGIMQYDGGLPKRQAEKAAYETLRPGRRT